MKDINKDFDELLKKYMVTKEQITGKSRKANIVQIRKYISFRLRKRKYSYPQIGHVMNRHHTTVMHYVGAV